MENTSIPNNPISCKYMYNFLKYIDVMNLKQPMIKINIIVNRLLK